VLPPTRMPPTPDPSLATATAMSPVTVTPPGTYGDLLARATASVQVAQRGSVEPFTDASAAHAELLGYERFLHAPGSTFSC
jgi:hypothetical protein